MTQNLYYSVRLVVIIHADVLIPGLRACGRTGLHTPPAPPRRASGALPSIAASPPRAHRQARDSTLPRDADSPLRARTNRQSTAAPPHAQTSSRSTAAAQHTAAPTPR